MMSDQEQVELKTIVGGKPIISNMWALSLVRRHNQEHAFLVLEGFPNGKRIAMKIDLKRKEGTNDTKAEIVSRDITVPDLVKLGANCHSITWHLDEAQREALENLVEAEKVRSQANLINYVMFGNSKVSGSVGDSLEASGSQGSVNGSQGSVEQKRVKINKELDLMPEGSSGRWRKLVSYMSVESADVLIRHGHNCYSWSESVVKAIKLPYQESFFKELIICNPSAIKGNIDGDEITTGSRCVMC